MKVVSKPSPDSQVKERFRGHSSCYFYNYKCDSEGKVSLKVLIPSLVFLWFRTLLPASQCDG